MRPQINTITQHNIKFTLFPDGQPHVDLLNIARGDKVEVVCRLRNSMDMMHLLQIANALDNIGAKKQLLVIPYLLAARYDRSMRFGDSVDLKVVAQLINSCNFKRIKIFDVHSPTALALIDRSENISNRVLVEFYEQPDGILICPDAGASKKVEDYLSWNPNITETIMCCKSRQLDTGAVALKVLNPGRCTNRNCVIIDDLCDGGATFRAIASQIEPNHLILIVSHGIFSEGVRHLKEAFDQIITSDSYQHHNDSQIRTIALYGN